MIKMKTKKKVYSANHPRKKLLDKKLMKMICVDFQPMSIVDDSGFIEYSHAMDERYQLPCSKTVGNQCSSSCLLQRMQNTFRRSIKRCEVDEPVNVT